MIPRPPQADGQIPQQAGWDPPAYPTGPHPVAAWQPGTPWRTDLRPLHPWPPNPWNGAPRWLAIRTPACWILGIATALCALGVNGLSLLAAIDTPITFLVIVLMVAASGATWTAGLLRLGDPVERRPALLVVAALTWGGSIAATVGGGAGYTLDTLVGRAVSPTFAAQWGAAIAAPYAEELGKGAGVVALLLVARPFLTTVWSGALYGALVGLGFMVYEDLGYALVQADDVLPDDLGAAVDVFVLRTLVPGLVGHPLFTATVGAGIAYAWLRHDRSRRRRVGVMFAALFGGAVMHATVNSPLASAAAEALSDQPYASYMAGYLLIVGAVSLPCLWWLGRVRREDSLMILERAAGQVPDAFRPTELATLSGLRTRFVATRRIGRQHCADAARRLRRLQRAQVRLAAALSHPYRGYPAVGPYGLLPQVQRWRDEVFDARAALPESTPLDAASLESAPPPTVRGWLRPTSVVAGAVLACALAGWRSGR